MSGTRGITRFEIMDWLLYWMVKRKGWRVQRPMIPRHEFRADGIRTGGARIGFFALRKKRQEWQSYVKQIPPAPTAWAQPRGIVMCAGGVRYFTCAWISIQMLRKHGCTLPIEMWHYDYEITPAIQQQLKKFNVECRVIRDADGVRLRSYQAKPFIILHSRFREVLFLDADNVCTRNPEYLFERNEFQQTGAVFWPDFWKTQKSNPIWKLTGSTDFESFEQESGQLLIDKSRCWQPLNLCCYFNQNADFYYQFLWGDKDTFKFAWMALKKPFAMVPHGAGQCGYFTPQKKFVQTAMVQHDFDRNILFLHRSFLKWDVTWPGELTWHEIRRFQKDARQRNYFQYPDHSLEFRGDVETIPMASSFPSLEKDCLAILEQLRTSSVYQNFLSHYYVLHFRAMQNGSSPTHTDGN